MAAGDAFTDHDLNICVCMAFFFFFFFINQIIFPQIKLVNWPVCCNITSQAQKTEWSPLDSTIMVPGEALTSQEWGGGGQDGGGHKV